MGQLQEGVYIDECEGLKREEINAFYDFGEDGSGEPQGSNEDAYQSDASEEQGLREVYVEEHAYEESENEIELDQPGCGYVSDLDHDFDMEVCFS